MQNSNPKNRIQLWIFTTITLIVILISVLLFQKFTKKGVVKFLRTGNKLSYLFIGKDPFGRLTNASQVILYPSQKKCSILLMNILTDIGNHKKGAIFSSSLSQSDIIQKFEQYSGIKIQSSVTLDENNLIKIIDIYGGIDYYFLPKDQIHFSKYTFKSGPVNLSGEMVSDFLTLPKDIKKPNLFINQMDKQTSILFEFLKKWKSTHPDKNRSRIVRDILGGFLSLEDFYSIESFIQSNHVQIAVSEIPGELSGTEENPYIAVREDVAKISFDKFENELLSEAFSENEYSRIEVLNGTEINGLAKKVKSLLTEKRFKVLSTDNAQEKNIKTTIVLNRSGNAEYAIKIAELLNSKVYHVKNRESGMDVTVIAGEDIEKKK